jgi:hypothetical protein
MTCKEILAALVWYRKQIIELFGVEEKSISLSSEYSFIKVIGPGMDISFQFRSTGTTDLPWTNEIIQQIETADNIAGAAVNCTVGDDYSPGNFSKVLLGPNHIELQQVNYMNARSLDHKDDYSLRSLVFRISLEGNKKMITEFTDRSSQNNRECGERIKAALDWTA